ncbi:uncharacterized protein TRAVEDRAFT_44723 [Trametes versicolor FP-101664 SS1]|uniref:uncharacterized protein n=1 Tax=Trametes versicolor (strain FP-101664) TaxID=717944 RepID=UPI0004621EF3|nr:uncharacterized protein TRAVEDRAFT_44723 [Trametes versicolor FP-101664 SS1]EIW61902.1 hypothetical protein TRAVEDRAFT_44723 [Trametes versicolor FP-101664 SS1]
MHESVPQLRHVVLADAYYADEDEEYDEYVFYPSRNELHLVLPTTSPEFLSPPPSFHHRPAFYTEWDDETGSEFTVSDCSMATSPTYSVDPTFNFADTVDDVGISSMGYSVLFRRGLWAQSSPIVKKLDAIIKQAVARLQSFKKHFARQPPAAEV